MGEIIKFHFAENKCKSRTFLAKISELPFYSTGFHYYGGMQPKRDKLEAWKYLVDDFLEMACFLNKEERGLLIEKISSAGASSETISSHPAFSLAGKLITVADKEKISEVWLYDAEKKKVKCFRLSDGQTR